VRVHVLHHASCFDGAASSAIFAAFFRARIDPRADVHFIAKHHCQGDPFVDADFAADVAAVVDFRYTARPGLAWFFDHHVSAFQLPGEREHFERHRTAQMYYDPAARSCAGYIARCVAADHGFDPAPHAELLDWAERIDSASFDAPAVPVELREPAMRVMTFIEHNRQPAATVAIIEDLLRHPLALLAEADYVRGTLAPVLEQHREDVELLRRRCVVERDVVHYDLLDQAGRTYNKFLAYYHHPACHYVVGLQVGPGGGLKLLAGYNPWLPKRERRHNIAALCERFGGGGHPYVGGIAFPAHDVAYARAVQRYVVDVLCGRADADAVPVARPGRTAPRSPALLVTPTSEASQEVDPRL
jgi:hypothetical protein